MTDRMFISHIFFFVALAALLGLAGFVLVRLRREPKAWALALLPLVLIFVTAYLGKNAPFWHRTVNVFYDGLLLYNAYYFFHIRQRPAFILSVAAIIGTALDFAMHFVIRKM